MAKKKAAASEEFNLSAIVREALTLDPSATTQTVQDYIMAKHPGATINKGSFSVAFYSARKKLGIKSGGKTNGKAKVGIRKSQKASGHSENGGMIDIATLQQAAKFLRDMGGAEAALEAIKQVQAVQVN